MSRVANICKASKQRGNALVLLILLKTWQGEAPDHYELAELAHISPRQAERDLLKLVADGDVERLSPEHHGGRGLKTRWRVMGAVGNADAIEETPSDMSESDKTPSDVTEFKSEESPSDMTGIPETTSHLTGLSDVNHDTLDGVSAQNYVTSDGTPVAPLSAETTTSNTVDANASTAPSAVSLKTYIGRLIQFRERELGTKLPGHKQEAVAAKWLYEAGYDFDDVVACYHFLIPRCKKWKSKGVTLNDVVSAIGDWKKGNLGDDERTQPQSNGKPSRSAVTRGRDYSRRWGAAGNGGGDAGADSGSLPDIKRLAAPIRR